jgi:hypothetical protein
LSWDVAVSFPFASFPELGGGEVPPSPPGTLRDGGRITPPLPRGERGLEDFLRPTDSQGGRVKAEQGQPIDGRTPGFSCVECGLLISCSSERIGSDMTIPLRPDAQQKGTPPFPRQSYSCRYNCGQKRTFHPPPVWFKSPIRPIGSVNALILCPPVVKGRRYGTMNLITSQNSPYRFKGASCETRHAGCGTPERRLHVTLFNLS